MDTGYATFITPIDPGEEEELRRYLCSEIEPRYDPDTILECKEAFRFDEIHSVHFCSFIILEGDRDEGLPPYLVFEATFDGPRDFFWTRFCTMRQTRFMRSISTAKIIRRQALQHRTSSKTILPLTMSVRISFSGEARPEPSNR